ncbi:MAG: DUF1800 domain-containing protein [Gemmatimonadota bacterium]
MTRHLLAAATLALFVKAPAAAQTALTPTDSARHVLNRLAYGASPGEVAAVAKEGVQHWIDRELAYRDPQDPALRPREAAFAVLTTPVRDMVAMHTDQIAKALKAQAGGADSMRAAMSQAELRTQRATGGKKELRDLNADLVSVTLLRAVDSDRQLAEVLADFWTNHFNVFIGKGFDRAYFADYLEHTIRPNVFARFGDLLLATAKSPAMLFYLDNVESVAAGTDMLAVATGGRSARAPAASRGSMFNGRQRRQPLPRAGQAGARQVDPSVMERIRQRMPKGINENYARELMELHTLGVDGGYTQADVGNVARILTGWGMDRRSNYEFRFLAAAHDRGAKSVLGVDFPAGHGEDEGIRLLQLLADQPATMHHISAQLCARFVADDPPDGCVDDAVRAWKRTNGDIREVMRAIIASPDFWTGANVQSKVKTPLEFVVSAVRAVGGETDSTPRLAQQLSRLGQPLFQMTTPNGYPEAQMDWVNSGALLARMNFAVALASGRLPGVRVDLDRILPATADHAALVEAVDATFLNGQMSAHTRETILRELGDIGNPREARALAVGLALGGPEFQRQ